MYINDLNKEIAHITEQIKRNKQFLNEKYSYCRKLILDIEEQITATKDSPSQLIIFQHSNPHGASYRTMKYHFAKCFNDQGSSDPEKGKIYYKLKEDIWCGIYTETRIVTEVPSACPRALYHLVKNFDNIADNYRKDLYSVKQELNDVIKLIKKIGKITDTIQWSKARGE